MQYSNLPPKEQTQTQEYFQNYYSQRGYVAGNTYDALIARFEKQTNGDKDTAKTIVAAIIQTSIEKNIDINGVADKFQKMSKEDINRYVISMLNMSRKNSSFLGFKNTVKNSTYVQRTVLP